MNDFRLLVAIPSLYNPANYGRFSVCFLSPGVSYPPVSTVDRQWWVRWPGLRRKKSPLLTRWYHTSSQDSGREITRVILKRQFAANYSLVECEFFRQTETPWSKMTNLRAATCAIFWLFVGVGDLENFFAVKQSLFRVFWLFYSEKNRTEV